MAQSGKTFGAIRYKLMQHLHEALRNGPGEESTTAIEAAVAMPPRQHDELLEAMRDDLGEDDVPPLPLETAMTLDDDADPEDLDASWSRAHTRGLFDCRAIGF